jgi:hypothetical protein
MQSMEHVELPQGCCERRLLLPSGRYATTDFPAMATSASITNKSA